MWIQHSNGNVVLVLNPDHITRLLNEGGHEIADPTITEPKTPKKKRVSNGSTGINDELDHKSPKNDSRSRKRKSAV